MNAVNPPEKPPLLLPSGSKNRKGVVLSANTNQRILPLWLLNILLPGIPLLRKGSRWFTKTIGILALIIWLTVIAASIYVALKVDLKDLGLTIISSPQYLDYAIYGLAGLGALWIILHLTGSFYATAKSSWRRWKKVLLNIIAFLISATLAAGVVWGDYNLISLKTAIQAITTNAEVDFSFSGEQAPEKIDNEAKPWGDADRINIMLLGSDAGSDRWGTRPDILMVASINTKTGSTQLFNIPRNLEGAYFPEGTSGDAAYPYGFNGLINAVWTWAESRPDLYPDSPRPGLTATKDILSETLGLDINYYMVVNMQGFVDLVNVLGGVVVDVPRDLPVGNQIVVNAGADQRLDGQTALMFSRSRSDSSDYDRILRQRCVITAMIQQVDGETIATKLPDIFSVLGENLTTNIQQQDIKAWVELFDLVRGNTIQGFAFISPVISPGNPDFSFIKAKVQELIVDPPFSPYVQTGSGSTGDLKVDPSTQQTMAPVQQDNPYC